MRQYKRGLKESLCRRIGEDLMKKHLNCNYYRWRLVLEHFKHVPGYGRDAIGMCDYERKVISINLEYTPYMTRPEFRNTVLHEIAHVLTPGHGHDDVWKKAARSIGCTGERCGAKDLTEYRLEVELQKGILDYFVGFNIKL